MRRSGALHRASPLVQGSNVCQNTIYGSISVSIDLATPKPEASVILTERAPSRFVVLAPPGAAAPDAFHNVTADPKRYRSLIESMQNVRGEIYRKDGAIGSHDLTADGRHLQAADSWSWHILGVRGEQSVHSCARFTSFPNSAPFEAWSLARSALAKHPQLGLNLRYALDAINEQGRRDGALVAEVGGWAVAEDLRGTREALRLALAMYALGNAHGRTIAVCTATVRHNSSSILKRLGAVPLTWNGEQIPPYYESTYGCMMELLLCDSARLLCEIRRVSTYAWDLHAAEVIRPYDTSLGHSLLNLAAQLSPGDFYDGTGRQMRYTDEVTSPSLAGRCD
jgi:hypothetical protein